MKPEEIHERCQRALLEDSMLKGLFVWHAKRLQEITPKFLLSKDGIKEIPPNDFILNEIIKLINDRQSEIIRFYEIQPKS